MKRVLVLILSVIMIIGLYGCESKNYATGMSLQSLNIKGDVLSVKMETFSGFTGEAASGSLLDMGFRFEGNRELEFNEEGMVTNLRDFTTDDTLRIETMFSYDKDNMMVSRLENYYAFGNPSGGIELRFETEDGQVIIENNTQTVSVYVPDESEKIGYLKYEFNENKQIIKTIRYAEGMASEVYDQTEYDEDGYIIKLTYFIEDEISGELSIQYDENHNMLQLTRKSGDEIIIYDYEYAFDDEDNWIEQRIYRGADHKFTTIRTIDYK